MAGLYEIWRDPAKDRDDPSAWLWTSTVLTTTAEDAVGHVHDRMPLLVEPDRWRAWLNPAEADRDRLIELLVPAAPGRLEAYPVSTEVNNVRNDGARLIDPLPAEQVPSEPATLDVT
jgi:putative SOS response-associated peptidase YedK